MTPTPIPTGRAHELHPEWRAVAIWNQACREAGCAEWLIPTAFDDDNNTDRTHTCTPESQSSPR